MDNTPSPVPRPARRSPLAAAVLAALLASGLAGCRTAADDTTRGDDATAAGATASTADGPTASSSAPSPSPATVADVLRVAVVGDSITAGTGPNSSFESPGDQSWLIGAAGAPLAFVTGWAVPGTTSAQMRAGVGPMDADVLVLMAGTNDLQLGTPWEETRDQLLGIVDAVGVQRTVLLAVPPLDELPSQRLEFDQHAAELAREQDWTYADPWTEVAVGGSYVPGASSDGVHPTPATAAVAGAAVRQTLLDQLGD